MTRVGCSTRGEHLEHPHPRRPRAGRRRPRHRPDDRHRVRRRTRQRRDPVTRWLDQRAHVLNGVEPPDRTPTSPRWASGEHARIVGLGEAEHGLAEITTLKHRALRYLVEHEGFRSIAWEEDWSLGTRINDYVLGRRDDRDALVGQMTGTWSNQEVADVLTWLRRYNAHHRDKVRFFGVEYYATRPFAYDGVESYVASAAPGRLARAKRHLAAIRPFTDDTGAYLRWFMEQVADKAPYVRHARKLHDLVAAIPHRPGDRRHAMAEHAARQIQSWYVAFSIQGDNSTFRDARAAENLRWWQRLSDDKIVYWAASAHTANAPHVRMSSPSFEVSFASVGSYLRTGTATPTSRSASRSTTAASTPTRPVGRPPAGAAVVVRAPARRSRGAPVPGRPTGPGSAGGP